MGTILGIGELFGSFEVKEMGVWKCLSGVSGIGRLLVNTQFVVRIKDG
jgi:hypothetical protein